MKKLAIIAATAAILSTSAFANGDTNKDFYVKGGVGMNLMNKVKDKRIQENFEKSVKRSKDGKTIKTSAKIAPFIEAGVGYYVNDFVRTDLTFAHFINPQSTTTFKTVYKNKLAHTSTAKHKATISTMLLNGYVDVFNVSDVKFFVGAGVGVAKTKVKVAFNYTDHRKDTKNNKTSSSKNKTNFSYQVTLGSAFKVTDNMHIDVAYSFRDFGKTKANPKGYNYSSKYRSHNLATGIRFDI